jgi:hypothetical protein
VCADRRLAVDAVEGLQRDLHVDHLSLVGRPAAYRPVSISVPYVCPGHYPATHRRVIADLSSATITEEAGTMANSRCCDNEPMRHGHSFLLNGDERIAQPKSRAERAGFVMRSNTRIAFVKVGFVLAVAAGSVATISTLTAHVTGASSAATVHVADGATPTDSTPWERITPNDSTPWEHITPNDSTPWEHITPNDSTPWE